MASANDLIVLFLGLETLSLALYVLAASNRRSGESAESGIKYFVLGGFSSAFFLYGIALVYGTTGTTNISEIVGVLQSTVAPFDNESLAHGGHRTADGGPRIQGGGRPVPRVGTGRLPGRTDTGVGVHGIGRQGRGVRGDDSRPRRGAAVLPRRLASDRLGALAALAARRFVPRRRAGQCQAAARLLLDQPRRVHPRRHGGSGPRRG